MLLAATGGCAHPRKDLAAASPPGAPSASATALPPDPLPVLDATGDKRARELIAALAEVSEQGIGYAGAYSGTEFLPYPETSHAGVMLLQQPPPVSSAALRAIVELGAPAVPALVECLSDARPTKVPPVRALEWMSYEDEYDVNRRTQPWHEPPSSLDSATEPQDYVVKVGDLCFVALGQILNRHFNAVRYQPSGGLVINSPPRSPALRRRVTEGLRGFTAERHRADLLRDFREPDFAQRREGAALRLSFYYPHALEEAALEILRRDTYDVWAVEGFAREELYKEPDPKRRRARYEAFVAEQGAGAKAGLLLQLFHDLSTLEAEEEHRITPPLTAFRTQPRELLVLLYGRPPDVRSKAVPYVDALSTVELASTIDALRHVKSARIEEAVRAMKRGDEAERKKFLRHP
jgi:hypothetical protein